MKAWEVRDNRLILDDVEPPIAGEGESILDVVLAGICGSDLPKLRSPSAFDLPRRWRPGHEIVGVDSRGTICAVDPLIPCEACSRCISGDVHLCGALARIGWDRPGGLANQVAVPNANIHPIGGIPALVAVLADPMAVAVHGLRCSGLVEAKSIAVIGAGAIGLLTAVHARRIGKDVTLVARRSPRVDLNGVRVMSVDDIRRRGFDVVVDAASGASAEPLGLAVELVGDGGTIVVQNAYHPAVRLPGALRDIFRRSIRLVGSFSFCRRDGSDFSAGIDTLRTTPEAITLLDVVHRLDGLVQVLEPNCRAMTVRRVLAVK